MTHDTGDGSVCYPYFRITPILIPVMRLSCLIETPSCLSFLRYFSCFAGSNSWNCVAFWHLDSLSISTLTCSSVRRISDFSGTSVTGDGSVIRVILLPLLGLSRHIASPFFCHNRTALCQHTEPSPVLPPVLRIRAFLPKFVKGS